MPEAARQLDGALGVGADEDAGALAPFSRRMRVSLRVSMPEMATMPCSARYSGSDCVERKFDTRAGQSRTTRPEA